MCGYFSKPKGVCKQKGLGSSELRPFMLLFTCQLKKGKGKVIPLQAWCGPEGG